MRGMIFNEHCSLFGPEAQRILEEEAARYRSIVEQERPDLVEDGYLERFESARKAPSRCDSSPTMYAF